MKRFCVSPILSFVLALPLAAGSVRVIQTNAAGDTALFIDPATNKVVLTVKDLEAPHGVASSPDGTRAYFTVESDSTVVAVDTKTGKHLGKVALSDPPWQGFSTEMYIALAVIYIAFCYAMSRYSRNLERDLNRAKAR